MAGVGTAALSRKLLFVVNTDQFFISHRLPIAIEAMRCGYEVHIATSLTGHLAVLREQGLIVHPLRLNRRSTGILSNVATFLQMLGIFRAVKPDIVHLVTIKPVLLGGMAARLASVSSVVVAISGLGFVFVSRGLLAGMRRWLVGHLYRLALAHANIRVIFQNEDDRRGLIQLVRMAPEKAAMIRGSGVDLTRYVPSPLPAAIPVVVLAARLLVDKGVREFVGAARVVNAENIKARFVLVGEPDPGNPASITTDELNQWVAERVIESWGRHDDMPQVLSSSHLVVLPSFYGEGLPKVLIEAAACGRAVVTTDHPGCRDAIEPDVTGLLVPVRNVAALASAIQKLLDDPVLLQNMGRAGRLLAERAFDVRAVVAKHLQIYDELLNNASTYVKP